MFPEATRFGQRADFSTRSAASRASTTACALSSAGRADGSSVAPSGTSSVLSWNRCEDSSTSGWPSGMRPMGTARMSRPR